MKKEAIFILLILSIALCSSISLEIQNPNMQPGETFLAELSGDFVEPISKSNVEFYKNNRRTYPEYNIAFYNSSYHFYVYFTDEGNFTIKIKNILYREPELKSTNIEELIKVKENTLENNKTKILSIKPGFIITSNEAEITLSNKGSDDLEISSDLEDIILKPGNYKKYQINPKSPYSTFTIKTYSTFTIPIIYAPLTQNESQNNLAKSLISSLENITITLISTQPQKKILTLENTGNSTIKNIKITSEMPLLQYSTVSELGKGESEKIEIEFLSKEEGFFNGSLIISYTADSKENLLKIPIEVYVLPNNADSNQTIVQAQTCEEINATTCKKGEKCNGKPKFTNTKPAKYCCDGVCIKSSTASEESGANWYFGILIFALIALTAFIIYKKFKKTKPLSPKQQLQKTSQSYKNRISGGVVRS